MMKRTIKMLPAFVLLLCGALAAAGGETSGAFPSFVDGKGNISMPSGVRSGWLHLGTWVMTSTPSAGQGRSRTGPVAGVHNVYAQAASAAAYRKTGKWPDGAVIVMEVRSMSWDDLSTGHVIMEGELLQTFVMVKDAKGRFPSNPNWGDGWGWALFMPADAKKNVSTDYRKDCMDCHGAADQSDFIFIQGYPALR